MFREIVIQCEREIRAKETRKLATVTVIGKANTPDKRDNSD